MIGRNQRLRGLIVCGALLLTACTSPTTRVPAAQLAATARQAARPTQPIASTPARSDPLPTIGTAPAYPAPPTQQPAAVATESPTDIAQAAEPTLTPLATPAPLTMVEGEVVLRLGAGEGQNQIGIYGHTPNIDGPRAFRIGGDGSIRILDSVNNRVLFVRQDGQVARVLKVEMTPLDFIVNEQGEVFVYASDGFRFHVLHYSADGQLVEQLPISPGVSVVADGMMLNSKQDLMLVQGNQVFWTIRYRGIVVAPEIQPLTQQDGAVTPRSPTIFQTATTADGRLALNVIALGAGLSGESMMHVVTIEPHLPVGVQFFNVDRAMNLYYVSALGGDEISVWRVTPDGTVAGGARIAPACQLSWRRFYIDQAGAVWTMCTSATDVTVTRYRLLDSRGQLLPEAEQEAADVAWRPGQRLDGA